jgi:hypothetical protein
MRFLLLCALTACGVSSAAPAPVANQGNDSNAAVPLGVPPPVDANPDAILPLPPVPDAQLPQLPADAVAIPQ